MNLYAHFRKYQHGFFSSAEDVLKFHKSVTVEKNIHGLHVLRVNGSFQASFTDSEYEDAVIYYGNKETIKKIAQQDKS